MDTRKFFLQALFVALLIILPVPTTAAPLAIPEQSEQTDGTPPAPASESTTEPAAGATAETGVEATVVVTAEVTAEATTVPPVELEPEPTVEPSPELSPEPVLEPTREPTPVPAQAPVAEVEDESANMVVDLYATAGRLRGRVELGWRFVAPASDEDSPSEEVVFVVERSTNGGSWRPVKVCYQSFDPDADAYSCTDSRLTSGTTYAYRVCLASRPTTCSNAVPTDPVSVKAP